MENVIPGSRYNGSDTKERFSEFDGTLVRGNNNRNNSKMGEAFKAFINAIGFTTYLMGIVANWNNWISIALGAVGVGFGIVKLLHAVEVLLIKRMDRKEKERDFKYNRSIEEEENDEY